jgi:hypothetical protein
MATYPVRRSRRRAGTAISRPAVGRIEDLDDTKSEYRRSVLDHFAPLQPFLPLLLPLAMTE